MTEPAGVLARIAAAKRSEVASRLSGVRLDSLRARAVATGRSLTAAVRAPGARFILEIKKGSPSGGPIRPGADAAELARGYGGIADALSVLTDNRFFGGSLEDLAVARAAFNGPILAKDFFIDPRQVVEARIAGADAVLVMLSLLDDERAVELIDEARRLGMDALVEVHNETEMRRALAISAPLIGINNRNLRDLSIDLRTTERLAKLASDCLIVSESGIREREDVERLAPRVDGFLVGTALMSADRPAEAARALIFGRVKLCGLNQADDIVAGRPATYAGLVFAPDSPRHVTVGEAARLAGFARRSGILPVGVFRDASHSAVADAATLLHLHAVQLHGSADADYLALLRTQLPPGCEIWRAVNAGGPALRLEGADRLLFDNGRGGTGRGFDWALLHSQPELANGLVAGGIGPGNVRAAARLGAYAIDVGSAVDLAPGRKCATKLRSLFERLRPPCRSYVHACA